MKTYTSLFFIEYLFFGGWLLWGRLVKMWLLSENKRQNNAESYESKRSSKEDIDKNDQDKVEKVDSKKDD